MIFSAGELLFIAFPRLSLTGLNKTLLINTGPEETVIAILEEGRLSEIHKEESGKAFAVGDVYLGKVKKLSGSLNAAFVDVGHEKDAFLHYLDLGENFSSLSKYTQEVRAGQHRNGLFRQFTLEEPIPKEGKITDVLIKSDLILVQIVKEPISTKGPRLTSEISFAGRFLVLIPFSESVSVSKKIASNAERTRLKKLVLQVKEKSFGVIIRTAAEGVSVEEITEDLLRLTGVWKNLVKEIAKTSAPNRVFQEMNRTQGLLRDLLNDSFNEIITNDDAIFKELQVYLNSIAPDKVELVKQYKGKKALFDHYDVDRQILNSFGKTVGLKGGAYLIFDRTEAMHVIDVNSGNRNNSLNQEENAFQTNMEAVEEIARQLRLRDLGGIIVVDLIDMPSPVYRKQLFDRITDLMASDRARHTILPISRFGLLQITRQRVRPEVVLATQEICPTCEGSGSIRKSKGLIDQIESQLDHLLKVQNEKQLKLVTNPYLAAYLCKGLKSPRIRWLMRYGRWIKIEVASEYTLNEFHFFRNNEQIVMN